MVHLGHKAVLVQLIRVCECCGSAFNSMGVVISLLLCPLFGDLMPGSVVFVPRNNGISAMLCHVASLAVAHCVLAHVSAAHAASPSLLKVLQRSRMHVCAAAVGVDHALLVSVKP